MPRSSGRRCPADRPPPRRRPRRVLAPADGYLAVEHEGRVGPALPHQLMLVVAVRVRTGALLGPGRMEPGAPATSPDSVVPPAELGEGVPGFRAQRPDPIRAHGFLQQDQG